MENFCFQNSVSLFVSIMVLVLLPRLTLSATSTYTRPEKFYVNCGSDSNVFYGGQTFVGDKNFSGNSVSFTNRTEVIDNQSSVVPEIYRTVRIFRRPSSYEFKLDSLGLHFVRLHFSVVFSRADLLTARFTVSAISGSNHHLKSFPLQNFTETPRVEEFLLMMDSLEFEIRLVPDHSSLAFVNAIEVFPAPNDLEIQPDFDKNLHMIYRLNVGGEKITPDNDTLGRTWSPDDEDFLYRKDSARNINSTQTPNYNTAGSLSATEFTAPAFVYKTAKAMNRSSNERVGMLTNVTWSFKVKSNYRHFIRIHFSDILSNFSNSDSDFYLYVNGYWRVDVKPSEQPKLATPFFIDVVNVSDGSGLLNISIGTKEADKDAGFLNGLEMMEFLIKSGSDSSNRSSSRVHIIAGCVSAAASALVLSLLFMVFLKRRRSKKTKPDVEGTVWSPLPLHRGGSSDNRPISQYHNSPLRNLHLGLTIPFTDILSATNNFDEELLIGKGGFGDVYKAILPDGTKAAIKRGKTGSGQGILEFQTEIQVLSRIRHKHLVSLTGYCEENSEMILVYEFMEKGTLKEHLYGSNLPPLSWKQRLEICIGAARGLHYLHSCAEGVIIHRDVKSTNILLDENTIAKVADFGLSKLTIRNQDPTNISLNIKGTFGYLDPEYLQTHILTEKSDVYAFGVVLLEVLLARPALDCTLRYEEANLAEWALFCKSEGKIDEILDPSLIGQIETNSLKKFMEIAEKCLKECGDERPSMGDVIWDLEYVLQLQMMTIRREAHEEDSTAIVSSGGSLVAPRLMVSDSFSTNSFVQKDDESKNRFGFTDSSETRVFSQLKISDAR
ncbi:probable receptor-like protein kinase At2g23200 [Arabidopsis lyrata subsp. lyrata]|uniref:probable receptor-like protein kinase At2g23200 n=1 Tax=Arabidopsis lyrata subsp. lyrata TaxID=81972 RepID=UPI000A29E1B5|nr:probable receptor-like protein kinase At2g23200 [Arabidopsis lyrata subsp. lyrata]|eukprot:XP_020883239.1 probable receptor-like protein kinase At2g23200 [Arabidopsis lyrata subsp. lyrata]